MDIQATSNKTAILKNFSLFAIAAVVIGIVYARGRPPQAIHGGTPPNMGQSIRLAPESVGMPAGSSGFVEVMDIQCPASRAYWKMAGQTLVDALKSDKVHILNEALPFHPQSAPLAAEVVRYSDHRPEVLDFMMTGDLKSPAEFEIWATHQGWKPNRTWAEANDIVAKDTDIARAAQIPYTPCFLSIKDGHARTVPSLRPVAL